MQKSIRFFTNTDPALRARVEPASNRANPACMKKTRKTETNTHT